MTDAEDGLLDFSRISSRWKNALETINNSRIERILEDFDASRMEIEREDTHETSLFCRLLVTTEDGEVEDENLKVEAVTHQNEEFKRVEQRLERLEKRLESCQMSSMGSFKNSIFEKVAQVQSSALARDILKDQEITDPNLILTISVYSSHRPGIRMQTFDIMASAKLSKLRDRISCITERILAGTGLFRSSSPFPDVSGAAECLSTSVSNSAYFFIEGVFYSDIRGGEDLSLSIRNWIQSDQERRELFGAGSMISMEEIDWLHCPLRLNRPYSFVHCGKCEHYIVIEHLRLEHPFDNAQVSRWSIPIEDNSIRELYHIRRKRRKCRICDSKYASWITVNDRFANENPFPFCHDCYVALHCDDHGALIYRDFKVYPYFYDL